MYSRHRRNAELRASALREQPGVPPRVQGCHKVFKSGAIPKVVRAKIHRLGEVGGEVNCLIFPPGLKKEGK